jgi:hypothetical protein
MKLPVTGGVGVDPGQGVRVYCYVDARDNSVNEELSPLRMNGCPTALAAASMQASLRERILFITL